MTFHNSGQEAYDLFNDMQKNDRTVDGNRLPPKGTTLAYRRGKNLVCMGGYIDGTYSTDVETYSCITSVQYSNDGKIVRGWWPL